LAAYFDSMFPLPNPKTRHVQFLSVYHHPPLSRQPPPFIPPASRSLLPSCSSQPTLPRRVPCLTLYLMPARDASNKPNWMDMADTTLRLTPCDGGRHSWTGRPHPSTVHGPSHSFFFPSSTHAFFPLLFNTDTCPKHGRRLTSPHIQNAASSPQHHPRPHSR